MTSEITRPEGIIEGWKPTGADPAAPRQEFYQPPPGPELGNPETDLVFTIRMQPPWTWERRHDPATPRAVLLENSGIFDGFDVGDPLRWQVGTGVAALGGRLRLSDDDVRGWPIQSPSSVAAVMSLARREKPQEHPAAELVGDMDVDAFMGGVGE